MIQLGEPLNRKKTIKCQSCGDSILYVLHDRKAGDRLRYQDVKFLQKTTVKNHLYCSKCGSPWINKSTGRIIKSWVKAKDETFKYFKPMIEDCKASKIKPSELTGCKCSKYKACKAIMVECDKKTQKEVRAWIKSILCKVQKFPCKPITGPGIAEMLKADKVNRHTGYTADSIIIDECKPLTKKQIKSTNDALNRMNAKKPTNKRGAR